MANQPEYIFTSPAADGPLFTVVSSDGNSSASLSIADDGLITFVGNMVGAMVKQCATASMADTASVAVSASSVSFGGIANLPTLVSSSTQINYTTITNVPAGIVSSSAQINTNLPTGTVSSSAQVLSGSNVVSSSTQFGGSSIFNVSQVSASFFGNLTGTSSWASNTTTAQTASFVATSSWANRAVTSSYAVSASYAVTSSYASVAQTLLGSVVSASYAVTSSWSATSSYISGNNIAPAGYSYAMCTSSLTTTVINTHYDIPFQFCNPHDSNAWTYSSGTNTYTCVRAGNYTLSGVFFMQKISGTAAIGAIRLVKNGQEISGSYSAFTFSSNNVTQQMVINTTDNFATNDVLKAQIIGSQTSIQLVPPPAVGTVITRESANLRIGRL